MDNHTLLLIFVIITAFSVLLQAGVLLGIFISVRKTAQTVRTVTEELKVTVIPMIHSSRDVLEKVTPQLISVSTGLADLTSTVRRQSAGVTTSATEIMERVNNQAKRLDGMLNVGLNVVEKAGASLESTIALPVRQANGIAAAIRAAIETYRRTPASPRLHPAPRPSTRIYPTDPGL